MKRSGVPLWGLGSVLLTPITPFLGSLGVVVVVEALVDKPHSVITNYFPAVSRAGVLVMLAALVAGVGSAVISLIRRERPPALAVLGLVTNAVLIVVFSYAHYFKLGYDQDRGALPAGFVPVGEGLTVAAADRPMQAAVRLFAAHELPARCAHAAGVVRLTAREHVQLRVEQPLSLATLNVAALDASGSIVPAVPVVIEAEEVTPPVLYLFPHRLEQGPTANSAGFFRFRVRTICPGSSAAVTVRAQAVHPR